MRLGFYEANLRQAPHVDDPPGVSLVLSGGVRERVGTRETLRFAAAVSIKPPGVRHCADYGAEGTLVLSVGISDEATWEALAAPPQWSWRRLDRDEQKLAAALVGRSGDRASEAALELLALARGGSVRHGAPPAWLRRSRERLCEDLDVPLLDLALEAGVHPVYFARSFRRWFGCSPSAFRLRRRTTMAIDRALFRRLPQSATAHETGFADQSHMCREIKATVGLSLSRLGRLPDGRA